MRKNPNKKQNVKNKSPVVFYVRRKGKYWTPDLI